MPTKSRGLDTLAIHAGQPPDPASGAVMPPIVLASTFAQESPGKHRGYEYSRSGNPTRHALEECLAALEGGRHYGLLSMRERAETSGGRFRIVSRIGQGTTVEAVVAVDTAAAGAYANA